MNDFPAALRAALNDSGMSQADLARESKLSRAYVNHLVTGFRGPGPKIINALLRAFPDPQQKKLILGGYWHYCLGEIKAALDPGATIDGKIIDELLEGPPVRRTRSQEIESAVANAVAVRTKKVRQLADEILEAVAKHMP